MKKYDDLTCRTWRRVWPVLLSLLALVATPAMQAAGPTPVAQVAHDGTVSLHVSNTPLKRVFSLIEKQTSYMIAYNFIVKEDKDAAKAFATKLQAIDPDNEVAKQILEAK